MGCVQTAYISEVNELKYQTQSERITWVELVKKMKIGDKIMVKGDDETIQELRYDGFHDVNGTLEIILTPLSLEFIKSNNLEKPN